VTPADLSQAISDLLAAALPTATASATTAAPATTAFVLQLTADQLPDQIHLERPRGAVQADWASNVALQLAKTAQVKPRDLAEYLAAGLAKVPGISQVTVAGPGFINITLDKAAAGQLVHHILDQAEHYGRTLTNSGKHVNVEFVSANPTGPIHLGGARWAAVGDAIAALFEATGATATREYYVNDHGVQIDHFAASLLATTRGQAVPENGYGGAYIAEIAAAVQQQSESAGLDLTDAEQAKSFFRETGMALMLQEIKQSLEAFGTVFDVWTSERQLHHQGLVTQALDQLKAAGSLYQLDGAWWLRSTDFGDDKDRVVIKSDGTPAYIAADIAYLRDKLRRGADLAVYLLGADHHGYIARLKAAAAALGEDPAKVEVQIGQLVSLVKDGQPVKMSKRAGTVVTMDDLVEAVGVDAARYAIARSSVDSPLTIDLGLWTSHSNDNPVYYVQYAHARTVNVLTNATNAQVSCDDGWNPALLDHPTEAALLGQLAELPRVINQACELRQPHRVARYLEEVAAVYHKWYDACRVIPLGDQPITDQHRSRLALNCAAGQVLRNGLGLLGVSAPERM
jgi:arginyl-tRNA synthetase